MTASELSERIQTELWGSSPVHFKYTLGALVVAVPASRLVPYKQRYLPLLVLGAIGSLADFAAGQRRAEPFQRALVALKQQQRV